jgi:tol-pal system protein YbgF
MKRWTSTLRVGVVAVAVALAGCATRSDLLDQERRVRGLIQQQNRSIELVKREMERLRANVEEGRHPSKAGEASPEQQRIGDLEKRLEQLQSGSQELGMTLDPNGQSTPEPRGEPTGAAPLEPLAAGAAPAAGSTPPSTEQVATATPPPTLPPPPPPPAVDDEWRREVAQDQAVAGTVDVPERAEYLAALQGLSHGDCAKATPELNAITSKSKGSPLADNALYWEARCHAIRGEQNQAVTTYYDVVTRYPKGDKAPAALWQQGKLFLRMGDSPDARLALSKLIKDYPASAEASLARQKLAELDH